MFSSIAEMKYFILIGLFIFLNILKIMSAQTTTLNTNITAFDGNVANGSSQTPQTFINPSVNVTNEAIVSTSTTSTVLPHIETNKSNENIIMNETQADVNANVTEKQLLRSTESHQTSNIHDRRAQSVAQSAIVNDTANTSELRSTDSNQFMLTTAKPSLVPVTLTQNSSETNLIKESLSNTASIPISSANINSIDYNSTNTLFPNLILQNDTKSPINHILGETIAANTENNKTQIYDTRSLQTLTTIQHTINNLETNQTSGSNPNPNTTTISHQSIANSTPIPSTIQTDPRKDFLSNFVIFASNNHTTTQNHNNDTSIKPNKQSERSFPTVVTLQDINKTESSISTNNNTVPILSDSLFNVTNSESIITNKTLETFNDSLSATLNSSELSTTERFTDSNQQNMSTINLSANISSLPQSSPAKHIIYTTNSSYTSIDTSSSSFTTLFSSTNENESSVSNLTSTDTVMSSTVKSTLNPNFSQYNNTVHLPMVKDIQSISKHDMTNIATITFIAEVVDIFQWVSITDIKFRNFICKLVDPELKWCTIFKFVYISPSPTVTNNHLYINFFIQNYFQHENEVSKYETVFPGAFIVDAFKNDENLTTNLEKSVGLKIVNLHTKVRTLVYNTGDAMDRRANVDLYVFFTVIMLICTVLLCLAIICSCARHKGNNMTQIELSNNAGISTVGLNGGIDLNSASNILREENQQKRYTNVINNEDCWVAPLDQIIIENEKISKSDTLNDTRL